MRLVFSAHAVMRYRRRIPKRAPFAVIASHGDLSNRPPATLSAAPADAWLVHGDAVFPLARCGDSYVAVTCLRWRRRTKAERRAWRAERREERTYA